jgi:hypothetical protein
MALLVATSGNPKRLPIVGAHASHSTRAPVRTSAASASTARSTTTTAPVAAHTSGTALTSTHAGTTWPTAAAAGAAAAAVTTTTTAPVPPAPTTTTTVAAPPQAGSHQGVIEPPAQRSSSVGFTGTGAMQVSVVWSGPTYLTMQVSCSNGTQNVGGSSAMAASLPDASGSCLATVSEPTSESTALTYTITIGPASG